MVSKLIAYLGVLAFSITPMKIDTKNVRYELAYRLPEVTITAAKVRHPKSFLGFSLLGRCNTNISNLLRDALITFPGPKVRITSLRRNWNTHSQHNCGKAVDMEWSEELIDFLVTEEATTWLDQHNLMFYIEDRPGSVKLHKYKNDLKYSKYVFENPHATGPHVHVQIKR